MTTLTSFFVLSDTLEQHGIESIKPVQTKQKYTEEELLAELNDILSGINTLDDNQTLINILQDIPGISLRFLYVFFQALVPVEMRIWKTAGMEPPFEKALDENLHLLLDDYVTFVLNLESTITTWARSNGFFDNDITYAFIKRRNEIYAAYVTFVGKVINALD